MTNERGDRIRRGKRIRVECGLEIRDRYEAGETMLELADAYGIALSSVRVILKENKAKIRRPGGDARWIGPRNHAWRGGTHVKDGYRLVTLRPDDPMYVMTGHRRSHYVPEHRLVMARAIGRPLRSDETVHHINGDRLDNRLENLQLRNGKHGKGSCWRCADCGSVNLEPVKIGEEAS